MLRNAVRAGASVALASLAAVLAVATVSCSDPTGPDSYVARYVTIRRVWRPGERDSLIASIIAQRTFAFPYVGDISDEAASILPVDSTTEIVPNPFLTADLAAGAGRRPRFAVFATIPNASWQITGLKVHTADTGGVTLDWLGYLFYHTADPTWKGLLVAASTVATANEKVDTPAFDAAFGLSGAGGGEVQFSSGTYWQANGAGKPNRLKVSASSFTGTATTVTTGPFLGGTMQTGTMSGQIQEVVMERLQGLAGDAADTADVSITNVASVFYDCIHPTPCTTNVLTVAEPAPLWFRAVRGITPPAPR